MNKKSFALSWGRKMFFGLGWVLVSLTALSYFQSMIIPQTTVGWVYFLTTFIGHYGLLLSLVYFFIYCPVVLIFPSYYVSRIWSVTLILSLSLFIFLDSYVFTRFRFHLNSFIWTFLRDQDALTGFGLTPIKLGMIGSVLTVLLVVLWIRGEILWRIMQGRFSNPVKSWYLVIISICFITSQLMYIYGDAKGARYITRLSNLFPLHIPITGKLFLKEQGFISENKPLINQGYKDFNYSFENLKCGMNDSKNVLLIVLDKWAGSELNAESTPNIDHLSSHGILFNNHFSGGLNKNDGYFSLIYSLPPTYSASAINQSAEPIFFQQMKKSDLELSFFQSGDTSPLTDYLPMEKEIFTDYIESHLIKRNELADTKPFLMHVSLNGGTLAEKDNQVKSVIDLFIKQRQIQNTIVVLTAAYSDDMKTPLLVIWPGKASETVAKLTSHYDVLPSIMMEDWKCKRPVEEYSFGKNIFSTAETEMHIAGNYRTMKILDTKEQTLTTLDQYNGVEVRSLGSMNVENDKRNIVSILEALHKLTSFYRP
jgi:membrane-anchored protein YejM (alkaline phosphatase superfamily)